MQLADDPQLTAYYSELKSFGVECFGRNERGRFSDAVRLDVCKYLVCLTAFLTSAKAQSSEPTILGESCKILAPEFSQFVVEESDGKPEVCLPDDPIWVQLCEWDSRTEFETIGWSNRWRAVVFFFASKIARDSGIAAEQILPTVMLRYSTVAKPFGVSDAIAAAKSSRQAQAIAKANANESLRRDADYRQAVRDAEKLPQYRDSIMKQARERGAQPLAERLAELNGQIDEEILQYHRDFPDSEITRPAVKLGKYQGLKIEVTEAVLPEGALEKALASLAEGRSTGVTDELAWSIGLESLYVLKKELYQRMTADIKAENESRTQRKVVDAVIEASEVVVPDSMVNQEYDLLIEDLKRALREEGSNWETFVKQYPAIYTEKKAEAKQRVLTSLVLDAIIKAERITVTKREAAPYLAELVFQYDLPVKLEQFDMMGPYEYFRNIPASSPTKQAFEKLSSIAMEDTLIRKVVEFLVANSEITFVSGSEKGEAKQKANTAQDPEALDKWISELESLIGLESVKRDVVDLINFQKVQQMRADQGLKQASTTRHLVFYGNPGTGKTTVARIIAEIYRELGILSKGHLVEVDRSGLVGGYLGQTAIKVSDVVKSALGGVLFIDEAYSLVPENAGFEDSFGQEAISTLLKLMEDNRENLVVIVAGYTEKMQRFISSNPGLKSRFTKYFQFDDYTPVQLVEIFNLFCKKDGYEVTHDCKDKLNRLFEQLFANRGVDFGNARDARNIFQMTISNQANRLASSRDLSPACLSEIANADVPELRMEFAPDAG
ncbi:MAG: AAA family ATPase [Candidatus Obscuribacterales bacterium]|nr:AAA family ATPase [Candidatus Obscuribacterales bacterium]